MGVGCFQEEHSNSTETACTGLVSIAGNLQLYVQFSKYSKYSDEWCRSLLYTKYGGLVVLCLWLWGYGQDPASGAVNSHIFNGIVM